MEKPRHLFVDGHNVLHAWGWLQGATGAAAVAVVRERLVEALRIVHDVERIAVTIVFDGRGESVVRDVAAAEDEFSVIYAPANLTADTVIERGVTSAVDPRACVVATADQLERETVLAAGAECILPAELEAWINRCRMRVTAKAKSAQARQVFENKLPL